MKTQIFHIHALSALHVGTGQGIGLIDLPVARERATHLPLLPGSGLKGVLRDELCPEENSNADQKVWLSLFGPETTAAEDNPFAGALMVGDAFLLCLPVRSLAGTFAWVTCPWVLQRYRRDLQLVADNVPAVPAVDSEKSLLTEGSQLKASDDEVVLEDLQLQGTASDQADAWAALIANSLFSTDESWQEIFRQRFLILSDDEFNHFSENATEVRARIRLKEDTRTVAKGALWYEENLPVESLFWGLLGFSRSRNGKHQASAEQLFQAFREKALTQGACRLQLGGKATVGRGQVRFLMQEAD